MRVLNPAKERCPFTRPGSHGMVLALCEYIQIGTQVCRLVPSVINLKTRRGKLRDSYPRPSAF